jgi:hypothetical protein
VLIDRNTSSTSESPTAKAHGRVDMLVCATKLLLAVVAALATGGTVAPRALAIVACAVAALQLHATVVYQPLANHTWNCVHGAFAAVFAWAAGLTLLALQRDRAEDQVSS